MEVDTAELEDVEVDDSVTVPLKRMPHNSSAPVFVALAREEGSLARGAVPSNMKFLVKEVDLATGEVEEDGYEDEYNLEDVEVLLSTILRSWCRVGPRTYCSAQTFWSSVSPLVLNIAVIGHIHPYSS